MRVSQKFLTYMVVGALVAALFISCKNEDKTGAEEVNIGQYAGIYASDTASYGPYTNQYFVLQVKSDTIDCSVSDSQSMSTIRGTLSSFSKNSGEEQIIAYEAGESLSSAYLTFSGNGLTCEFSVRFWYNEIGGEAVFTLQQLSTPFHMTKIN